MESLGYLEMDLKGNLKSVTGELETWDEVKRNSVLAMLEDAGYVLGEETFRRLVLEFRGYEYLITLTRENILVMLRENASKH
jgi:hypothetical protein